MQHRKCIVIKMRSAIVLIMIFVISGIRHSETAAGNEMNVTDLKAEQQQLQKDSINGNSDNTIVPLFSLHGKQTVINDTGVFCIGDKEVPCSNLSLQCIRCSFNHSCHYGRDLNVTCDVMSHVQCQGERTFQRQMNCRYCYQTPIWQQKCLQRAHCNSVNDKYYRTNCTVNPDVLCLGNRSFSRNLRCNWTQGYRWSTAFIISITLGGFGADRFYLGHWQEGIGKLFSFGGLGVWTIIDVLLISLHYLGPADGSLYI